MANEVVSLDLLSRQVSAMQDRMRDFGRSSGPGGGDGELAARVARLEVGIEHVQRDVTEIKGDVRSIRDNMRSDFRQLFGAVIAVALGLAAIMAKGFHWL